MTAPTTCRPSNSWARATQPWRVPMTHSMPSRACSAPNLAENWPSVPLVASSARLGQLDLARAALRKTIAVNPWMSDYHLALAKVGYQAGHWSKPSRHAARRSNSIPNWSRRGRSWSNATCGLASQTGPTPSSRSCCILEASREAWQQWYEQQKQENARPTPTGPP